METLAFLIALVVIGVGGRLVRINLGNGLATIGIGLVFGMIGAALMVANVLMRTPH